MSEISGKIDAAVAKINEGWEHLMLTTKSGTWFANQFQSASGHWLEAKKCFEAARTLLEEAKALADAPIPVPDPEPVPDPVPPPVVKPGFGFSVHLLSPRVKAPSVLAQKLASAKSGMFRDDCYYGTPDARIELFGALAAQNGQKLVLILRGGLDAPTLAQGTVHAKNVVARLNSAFPGLLHAVEPANEPNSNAALSDPAQYVAWNNAVYAGTKEADPKVLVWGGATNGDATAWAEKVITLGAHFDEWSCHPYPAWGFFPDAAGMLRKDIVSAWSQVWWKPEASTGKTLEKMLLSLGYPGLIHGTEFGAPTHSPNGTVLRCCTEQEQAKVWTLGYPMWRGNARAGWLLDYTGQDDDTWLVTGVAAPWEFHFGGVYSDGMTEKPKMAAMRLL